MLNAADYGVPQRRERVFLLGIRKDVSSKLLFPPEPTHSRAGQRGIFPLKKWIGVGRALEAIPEPDQPHNLSNHECSKYKLRFNGYLGHRHIDPELPAPTITARGDDLGGVVILHHPNNKRRLTARETAIIQSFPVDYYFHGTKTSIYRQVANAVPPMLAYAIARNLPKNPSQPTLREPASLRA
jgi:DNA (cytosine-5)-methyltransferase 1